MTRTPARLGFALFLLFAAAGVAMRTGMMPSSMPPELRISAGVPGGTYHELGLGLAEVLEREVRGVESVEVMPSAGSIENARRVEYGSADLGFVQNDTPGSSNVRSLALLYAEILHILLREGSDVESVRELAGRRVAVGPRGSGTRGVALRVLEQFGLDEASFEAVEIDAQGAAEALVAGEIDAAFVLSPFRSEAVDRACAGGARFLSLGGGDEDGSAAAAVAAIFPFYEVATIPVGTYGGRPEAPVATVSVRALLVASEKLAPRVAREITEALFSHRFFLEEKHSVAVGFRERYDPTIVQFPYHDGASSYYTRDRPSFLVEYAETLSFGVAMLAALGSLAVTGVAYVRRRNKDRIDVYYAQLGEIAQQIGGAAAGDLEALRRRLFELRSEAFGKLIDEQVQANDSFIIFQDYLRTLLDEVEERRRELTRPGS